MFAQALLLLCLTTLWTACVVDAAVPVAILGTPYPLVTWQTSATDPTPALCLSVNVQPPGPCGCDQTDTDSDGVLDCVDTCPLLPNAETQLPEDCLVDLVLEKFVTPADGSTVAANDPVMFEVRITNNGPATLNGVYPILHDCVKDGSDIQPQPSEEWLVTSDDPALENLTLVATVFSPSPFSTIEGEGCMQLFIGTTGGAASPPFASGSSFSVWVNGTVNTVFSGLTQFTNRVWLDMEPVSVAGFTDTNSSNHMNASITLQLSI